MNQFLCMYQLWLISQLLRLELEVVNPFLLRGCEPVSVYVSVVANLSAVKIGVRGCKS